eukprot:CCRYP_021051-RA/>CCRYP_021051-RA protein AED:0.03 eAED:0.03 QI:195/1/1/1/1/1/8/677/2245
MTTNPKEQAWVCDKCNVITFNDYNEACVHEAQCQGISPRRQEVSHAAAASAPAVDGDISNGVSSIHSSPKASRPVSEVELSHKQELNDHDKTCIEISTEIADQARLSCNASVERVNKRIDKQLQKSSDEWASSLVGRWWEVYWDPDRNEGDDSLKKMPSTSTHPSIPLASTVPSPFVPQIILEEQQPKNTCVESAPQNKEIKPRIQKINVLYTSARLGLSLQQVQFPTAAKVDSVIIDSLKQYRQLRQQPQELLLSYIIVKNILADAPNGHLLLVNDIITGINGNSFYSTEFQSQASGGGGDFFNRVVTQIKESKRPMIVNFERVVHSGDRTTCAGLSQMQEACVDASMLNNEVAVTTSTNIFSNYRKTSEGDLAYPPQPVEDLPPGWILRRIPRGCTNRKASDVYYFSPIMGYKFRSRPEVARYLECLQHANGNEEVAIRFFRDETHLKRQNSDIDDLPLTILQQKAQDEHHCRKRRYHCDSDDEDCEDAVDWYDAKILSYSNGEFVVYFLGDDEGVTYKMPLTPEVIRPSVRAWGTRSRCLIQHDLDFSKRDNDFESWAKLLRASLPPSTELSEDAVTFANILDVANSCNQTLTETDDRRKLQEYKQMISMQLHLAKRISPADDGIEDEEDQTSEPGPSLSSFQVKLLCRYLTEAHDACKWLLSEKIPWIILDHLSASNAAAVCVVNQKKVSKEEMLSFLVSGARCLDRLLRADPDSGVTRSQDRQTGKKKPRLGSSPVESITANNSLDQMLRNALLCDVTLAKVLTTVTTQCSERSKTKCVDSILINLIDHTYNSIWKPIADWVETADHIVGEDSQHIFSTREIENHLADAYNSNAVQLADLSPWTLKLEAKLSRAQFFEMETWSAIKACTQLNISRGSIASMEAICASGANDACFAALERLKREASMHPMLNINPLGKALVTSAGVQIPSPLMRSVIDDAIVVRLWVLDLMHAKLVRERSSFIEDVIRRFSALPRLPSPPFGGFDSEAQPSALLLENTKDSITILSANCYSYNHIIGNIGASLRSSINVNSNDSNVSPDILLRTKTGVASALIELRRLPILSVVEEKLCVRDELIAWNAIALDAINTTSSKLPFTQIQELYDDLENILGMKSKGRAQLCKNLRPNKSVDSEVHLFAVDDEPVICPVSGVWVREQYNKACLWKKKCDSVLSALELHGFFSRELSAKKGNVGLVDLESINSLCEEHQDVEFASSFPEFDRISGVREKIHQWSIKFDQILSDSITLRERCDRLAALNESRPKGVIVKPTPSTICLWSRVFSWPLKVQEGVKLLTSQFSNWKADHPLESGVHEDRDVHLTRLLKTCLRQLIAEGQFFLLTDSVTPSMNRLKDEAIEFICGSEMDPAPLKINAILDSTCHAKIGLNHIFDTKTDEAMGSPLFVLRVLFWKNMVKCFLQSLNNASSDMNTDLHEKLNLGNATLLLSLCPKSSGPAPIGIVDDKSEKERLRALIRDAEELLSRANAILSHATDLLHENNPVSRMDELEVCESGLASLLLNVKSNRDANLLLRSSGIEVKIAQKNDLLRWLLNTMSYPILWDSQCSHTIVFDEKDRRIALDAVIGLHASIPPKLLCSLPEEVIDAEVGRLVLLVKNLVRRAKQWQASLRSLHENGNSKIVELCTIKAIAQASILSMVIFPNEQTIQEMFTAACQMKDSLDSKLFELDGYNSKDVHKDKFPNEKSLMADSGDFLLYRLTGSEIYLELQHAMRDLKMFSDQLKITTAEKATYLWILDIYEWVEALNAAVGCSCGPLQLVINAENARRLLEHGYGVLHNIADEVKDTLALKKISIRSNAEKYSIVIMKGGALNSPGGNLLRWAAFLFESLKADVEREDRWRENSERAINSFSYYETGGKKISSYMARINGFIAEARDLVVCDNALVSSLLQIVDRVMKSQPLKKRLDDDLAAAEMERFNLEVMTYEGPPLVHERYHLLESIVWRASSVTDEKDPMTDPTVVDSDSLLVGDQSIRDKSRNFLKKSLLQGFETFGMESHADANDYCNVLAWDLEQAIFDKFKTDADDIGLSVSNEYREKVRCLRFNLQDPKNPMLCARVLSGQLKIQDLIVMMSDELASKELNLFRRQVQEEVRKSIVLSGAGECSNQNSATIGSSSAYARVIKSESHANNESAQEHEDNSLGTPSSHVSQSFHQRHAESWTLDAPPTQWVATSPVLSKVHQRRLSPPTPTCMSSRKSSQLFRPAKIRNTVTIVLHTELCPILTHLYLQLQVGT